MTAKTLWPTVLLLHAAFTAPSALPAQTVLPESMPAGTSSETAKPYREEEVCYTNRQDGTRLGGTLTVPDGVGPFPALLLITGSGPQDRDETIGPHKPFAVLADALTRGGVAVLRVDDRGVGKSTGKWTEVGFDGYAQDVRCGLELLKRRAEIDPHRVGLLGHSEGGRIGARVAAQSKEVAFLVMLASVCVPSEQFILRQNESMLRRANVSGDKLEKALAGVRELVSILRETPNPKEREERVRAVVSRKNQSAKETDREVRLTSSPWARDHMSDDPTPDLRALGCPVLALWGSKDVLVEPEQNVAGLRRALPDLDESRLVIRVLPDLNHLFQKCETGNPKEFVQLKETFNPAALQVVVDWARQQGRVNTATPTCRN
jgi:uncharacterized protein